MTSQIKRFQKLLWTKAFTLVELIIVIAIVAILSVVAFMVVTKWIGKSKDSRRLSDLGAMKRSLEVGLSDMNYVPMPDAPTGGSISTGQIGGVDQAYVGVYGNGVINSVKNMKSAPIDPTMNVNYAYGIDVNKKKYQVAVVLEDGSMITELINQVYAGTPISKVEGNYTASDMYKYESNSNLLTAVPSLVFTGVSPINLAGGTVYYMVDKGGNLAYGLPNVTNLTSESSVNSLKSVTNRNEVNGTYVDLSSLVGGTPTGSAVANAVSGMVGSSNDIVNIVSKLNSAEGKSIDVSSVNTVTLAVTPYVSNTNLSSSSSSSSTSSSSSGGPIFSCETQPSYTNATFTVGTPISSNTVWQNTNSSSPCYYSCNVGWGGIDCNTQSDPYWNNVSLLVHFNSPSITDVKGHTLTSFGTTNLSSTYSKFGGKSGYFDGTNSINVSDDSNLDIGLGGESFTIEGWIYPNSPLGGDWEFFDRGGSTANWKNSDYYATFVYNSDNKLHFQYRKGSNDSYGDVSATIPSNTGFHFALVNDSSLNKFLIYINGTAAYSGSSITISKPTGTMNTYIGADNTNASNYRFRGYIDEFRLTKGVARYSGSVITVPSSEFLNQ